MIPHPAPLLAPDRIHKHLAASLKAQWKRCRKRLKQCQREFSEEAVHDVRVEIRRLLSGVELLATFVREDPIKQARKTLKRQLDGLAELRDTQVQLLRVARLALLFPGARLFQAHLGQREKHSARQARRRIKQMKTARLGRLIEHFRDELRARRKDGAGERDAAALLRAVRRAFAEVARRRQLIDPDDTSTIHRTRVAFKKFRYMVEALAPLLPDATEARLDAMRRYQGMMGDIQDAEVFLKSFDEFRQDQDPDPASSRALRDEVLCRRQTHIETYLRHSDQLRQFWPPLETRSEKNQT